MNRNKIIKITSIIIVTLVIIIGGFLIILIHTMPLLDVVLMILTV